MGGNPGFPLGTDQIGRDILSRLIYGAQNTVGIAFITTCLAFVLGGTLGFLAATLGGWLDQVLSRGVDVLMAIPSLIFALLLMTIASAWAGSQSGLLTVYMVLIIAVIDSTRVFRLARAVGANIVVMDYIEAAKLRGEGMSYLIFKEILPNATSPLLAEFGLRFCFVFLTIASLSFLGVGIQPPAGGLGHDGARPCAVHQLRRLRTARGIGPAAGSRRNRIADGGRELCRGLDAATIVGVEGMSRLLDHEGCLDRRPVRRDLEPDHQRRRPDISTRARCLV